MIDDYSGLQKAAILLITLGPEKASAIFQHLKEDEIESLTLEIANTRSVSPQDKESVFYADRYFARSKFIFDRMTEREKIVRFVFEEERRIRRREME